MINIDQVTKKFNGATAVNNLSLNIEKGEIYGLLGPNGAGKSTTINMLLGFLKPDAGSVKINDREVITNTSLARSATGYIPENVNLYPDFTGVENLDYFCRLAQLKYSPAQLSDFLSNCGLQKEAHHQRVSGYSKGMRQKVGIAIAYAKKAKVLLLDEPASGLDPAASNELSEILKQTAEAGATILMASHDIFRVRETCHRIGILKHGQLVKEMRREEVTASELEQIYLQYMHD